MKIGQKGQATMEAVLLMIVAVVIATKVQSIARDRGFLPNIVEGPWSPIRGMIEDGVWAKHTVSKTMHPNFWRRHQARKGDLP